MRTRLLFILLTASFGAACGTVEPEAGGVLVVEAFIAADEPLPEIRLSQLEPLQAGGAREAVDDAVMTLRLGDASIPYQSAGSGRYRPAIDHRASAGDELRLEVTRGDARARSRSAVPSRIRIDSVRISAQPEPVEAVLIDSLNLSPGEVTGFVYLVDVDVFWQADQTNDDSYVRLQLRPDEAFRSLVIDMFLRAEEIMQERSASQPVGGVRHWRGVYAVQVEGRDDPMPAHDLRVALVRSGRDYARFALSRDAPDRREPIGNIDGGLGIFAGISIDSLHVKVTEENQRDP